mmetsp:Transcript_44451/g.72025  ORF Transcript_44451/g.72025 Transcript_44451/m.72025 type:complete len:108 (-) Transcript_44451:88-411(-)
MLKSFIATQLQRSYWAYLDMTWKSILAAMPATTCRSALYVQLIEKAPNHFMTPQVLATDGFTAVRTTGLMLQPLFQACTAKHMLAWTPTAIDRVDKHLMTHRATEGL